ncbi:MAG: TrkH family potassium uptake protein [Tannerellaceae bacterium]|jgi:trk system potassium uptake protein TrkH|nr:TrkH family potassium uptake protein [Tannerellaceae bacterium]
MLNIRFILKMLGTMFLIETIFMLLASLVALHYGDGDLPPFLISSAILFTVGATFFTLGRKADEHSAGYREGMLVVTLTWASLSFLGMLPFYIGGYISSIPDAYFETMSGYTTTGASILTDIESLPHGILFWRSLLQWQGGIGVVVFTVALLPLFGGGASQMFEAETTGTGIGHERFRPRVTQVAKRLSGVYFILTAVIALLLWLGPMNLFDAINHGLTTVSTGGYSTKNNSIAHWDSAYIEYIEILFMFVGSINVTLLYFLILKASPHKILHDEELRSFTLLILAAAAITTLWLLAHRSPGAPLDWATIESAIRRGTFQVMAISSSSGFMTDDYLPWGAFFWMLVLILMFIGGCSGSTSGGFKAGRFVIVSKHLSNVFNKQMHPNAILHVRMSGHVITADNVHRCLAFAFIYIALIMLGSLALAFNGATFDEALAASVSAISNIGPGLGRQGPASNYADMPAASKWILSFLMMTGRLELFTVLTLLQPRFWKN